MHKFSLFLKAKDEGVGVKKGDDNAKSADITNPTVESSGREMGVDIGRVGSWATDFEKLLSDPVGLRTFTVNKYAIKD